VHSIAEETKRKKNKASTRNSFYQVTPRLLLNTNGCNLAFDRISYESVALVGRDSVYIKRHFTNSVMELSSSLEAYSCAATQEFLNILWNLKVLCAFHKSPPLDAHLESEPIPPNPIFLRFIFILSTDIHVCLPRCLFLLTFALVTYANAAFLLSCYMTCPSHLSWLMKLLILHSFPTSCPFFHLQSNILLSTLFWSTFSLWSSLHFRDRDSHPYRTTGKRIVLCILVPSFLDSKRGIKMLHS
jgi:hypothetical protein